MRWLCHSSLKAHANISKIHSQERATLGDRSDRLSASNFAQNTVIPEDSIELLLGGKRPAVAFRALFLR